MNRLMLYSVVQTKTTICIHPADRKVLKQAAKIYALSYQQYMRAIALQHARAVLGNRDASLRIDSGIKTLTIEPEAQ